MRLQTAAIHTGVDKDSAYNSVITPIYATSTFRFDDVGISKGYDYSRTSNPTRKALEQNLAALEGGVGASAVAIGMAAITVVLHFFKTGDHLICTNCGKIVEFENCDIERLQQEVAARNGFAITTHKLELYGLCSACRQ